MTDAATINPVLVHVGIDWITVTNTGDKRAQNLFESGNLLMRMAVCEGNRKKPWSMSGFIGYCSGHVQFGTRGDEVMVRLSGDYAHDYWREVYDESTNCTRLDVQATYRLDCDVGPVISRHFSQAKRFREERKRTPTVSLLSTNNGPSTLYLNKRVSETFARVYDKGAESGMKEFERCIRYELELKGSEAARVSSYLRSHSSADRCAGLIAIQYFEGRFIRLGKSVICCERAWTTPVN